MKVWIMLQQSWSSFLKCVVWNQHEGKVREESVLYKALYISGMLKDKPHVYHKNYLKLSTHSLQRKKALNDETSGKSDLPSFYAWVSKSTVL